MLESFTVEMFDGRVGETFRVHPQGHAPLEIVLVSAEKVGKGSADRPFSLVFRGPTDLRLPQSTYRVEHAGIGAFDLFRVPIQPDEEGPLYEAVFN